MIVPEGAVTEAQPHVTAVVLPVAELDRSVNFYTRHFACRVETTDEDAAVLLTSYGLRLYLIVEHGAGATPQHRPAGQVVLWSVEARDELEHLAVALDRDGALVNAYERDDLRYVVARDPDGARVITTFPGPDREPHAITDVRVVRAEQQGEDR